MEQLTQSEIIAEIEADSAALNAGQISLAEFQRRNYYRQQRAFTPKLLEHRSRGEWEQFIATALSIYEVMPLAFAYYDEVPDSMKYNFAISAYIHHGDSIPAVRKAVRGARRYGKPDLPPELAAQEAITVYRAGEEPIKQAPCRISWTTSRETALFFLQEYIGRHATHLYRAKIKPEKVIAYTDARNEREIMQYRGVFDVVEITQEAGQWKS